MTWRGRWIRFWWYSPFMRYVRALGKPPKVFIEWRWCGLCQTYYLPCPKCGQAGCVPAYGEVDGKPCDLCPTMEVLQKWAWDNKRDEVTSDIQKPI